MTGKREDPERLIGRLLGSAAPDLGCDQCFELLDIYVEAELAGADPERRAPGMRAHLDGCPACAEEYESLRGLLTALG